MRLALGLFVLTCLAQTAATADEALTMEFRNLSSRAASISGIYEMRDGVSIDDNLGSTGRFAAGSTMTVTLGIPECTTVEIYAWLYPIGAGEAEEVRGETDLCKNRVMVLHD